MAQQRLRLLQARQRANMPAPPHTGTPYPGQAEYLERVRQMEALKSSGLPPNVQNYINTTPSQNEWEMMGHYGGTGTLPGGGGMYPGGDDAPDGVAPTGGPFGTIEPPNSQEYMGRGEDDLAGVRRRARGLGWPA
jgi:hypothetical protein